MGEHGLCVAQAELMVAAGFRAAAGQFASVPGCEPDKVAGFERTGAAIGKGKLPAEGEDFPATGPIPGEGIGGGP